MITNDKIYQEVLKNFKETTLMLASCRQDLEKLNFPEEEIKRVQESLSSFCQHLQEKLTAYEKSKQEGSG